MDYFLLIIAILFILGGIIGCVAPVLPGPPLSFIALVLLHLTRWAQIEPTIFWVTGSLAIIVTVLDYIIPAWGTKKFGGSKRGVWGATIGLLIGLFLGPIGIIAGPFLGAFIGELTNKTNQTQALRAAFGSFIGILTGVILKLIVSGVITFYFIKELI